MNEDLFYSIKKEIFGVLKSRQITVDEFLYDRVLEYFREKQVNPIIANAIALYISSQKLTYKEIAEIFAITNRTISAHTIRLHYKKHEENLRKLVG